MAEIKKIKKRNWAFILYPESAPLDWRELLAKTGLQCAISPLHNNDLDENGELKKPHYHIIICYNGPTSYNVVANITVTILKATIPQPLEQLKGYYRYLTHKDDPDKAQYDEADIQFINGFTPIDFIDLSKSEAQNIKDSLILIIHQENFTEYCDFYNYLLGNGSDEERQIVSANTYFFNSYIKSRKYKAREQEFSHSTKH